MRNCTGWIVVFLVTLIVCGIAIWFCVMYYNHYKSWPFSDNPVGDYMLEQSKNTSLDPNTRNILKEASKWVRVFNTLKKNGYVYSTNGKKYDMTIFRNENTAEQNESNKTPYTVVTKFALRNPTNDKQDEGAPITNWTDSDKVKINVGNCTAVDGKENEFKCASVNVNASTNTDDNTIEMFTTCGGY